jgi:hypothetical protein
MQILAVIASAIASLPTDAFGQGALPQMIIADVHGTALQLVASRWIELKNGDNLYSLDGVRTLHGGEIEFRWHDAVIHVGPETALMFELEATEGPNIRMVVFQYAGSLGVDCSGRCSDQLTIRTPTMEVASRNGSFSTIVTGIGTEIAVSGGQALATSLATGQEILVQVGERLAGNKNDHGPLVTTKLPGNPGGSPSNGNGASGNNGVDNGNPGNNGNGEDKGGNNGKGGKPK